MRLRRTALILGSVLWAAAPGPAAGAAARGAYAQVLGTYERTGNVPACAFSTAQLAATLKNVDVYGQQYFADFTQAVQNALAARAAGACTRAGPGAGAISANAPPGPALRLPPQGPAAGDGGIPLPVLLLGVLALMAAAGAGSTALARWRGWGTGPPGAWRHLWLESTWRAGALSADFGDWLRLERARERHSLGDTPPADDGAGSADRDRHRRTEDHRAARSGPGDPHAA